MWAGLEAPRSCCGFAWLAGLGSPAHKTGLALLVGGRYSSRGKKVAGNLGGLRQISLADGSARRPSLSKAWKNSGEKFQASGKKSAKISNPWKSCGWGAPGRRPGLQQAVAAWLGSRGWKPRTQEQAGFVGGSYSSRESVWLRPISRIRPIRLISANN